MSEHIITTAIICVTIAFCVFMFCAMLSTVAKYNKDCIDRDEFEEYEHMINERFKNLEK